MKRFFIVAILQIIASTTGVGQELYSDLYQYSYSSLSPAFAGSNGTKITAWGTVFTGLGNRFPAERNSAFMGFETRVKKIRSGFGFNASAWRWSGYASQSAILQYNYYIPVGEEDEIIIGLRGGLFSYSFTTSFFYPIDQNDPLFRPDYVTTRFLQLGAGAIYKSKRWFAGISPETIPGYGFSGLDGFGYVRKGVQVNCFAGANADFGENISTVHSLYAFTLPNFWRIDLNTSAVFWNRLIAGVSVEFHEEDIFPKANAGIKFKDLGQVVVMLYSRERAVEKTFSGQLLLMFNL